MIHMWISEMNVIFRSLVLFRIVHQKEMKKLTEIKWMFLITSECEIRRLNMLAFWRLTPKKHVTLCVCQL